jgi:hypothetical protein
MPPDGTPVNPLYVVTVTAPVVLTTAPPDGTQNNPLTVTLG